MRYDLEDLKASLEHCRPSGWDQFQTCLIQHRPGGMSEDEAAEMVSDLETLKDRREFFRPDLEFLWSLLAGLHPETVGKPAIGPSAPPLEARPPRTHARP